MNDDDLKKRFRELRAHDTKRAPNFDALTATRPRRTSPLVVLAPMLAAAAVLVVWCGSRLTTSAEPPSVALAPSPAAAPPSPAKLRAPAALPLDFLLESSATRLGSVRLDSDPTEGLRP